MTTTTIEAGVKSILTKRLGMPAQEIALEASLVDDLGADSLDFVEMAIAAEREFNVAVNDETLAEVKTVKDLVSLVERLVLARAK